ncbi:MAG TPA: ABC transporter substrate-binding protein [Solirubrobacterales bacterium]|nr:ABC transporter substrate-binding protein [Solirubrobacterales bacterium]
MSVALDGYPNPGNVGILVAAERDYFEEAGLRVTISSPIIPTRPVRYLSEGIVDLTISHLPQVALARENNKPVVAVASLIPEPTTAMIWLEDSEIDDIADLKGKSIAFPGLPFQEELLRSLLAQAGLTLADVELKQAGYEIVPALLEGRADAIFGASSNVEGAELEAREMDPVVTPVEDLDVPAYEELVLVARPGWLSKNKGLTRDFLSAMARGTAAAVEDPDAATETVLARLALEKPSFEVEGETDREAEEAKEAEEASREGMEAGVEATLPLLSPTGSMSKSEADLLVDWMLEEGMIRQELPASALLTNAYLKPRS